MTKMECKRKNDSFHDESTQIRIWPKWNVKTSIEVESKEGIGLEYDQNGM